MALIMLERGNLELAHEYGQKAIAHAPNSEEYHSNYAKILLKEGNLEGAIKAATQAIALKPDFIDPLDILGEAYRIKRNYTKSEYYWKEFLRNEPNDIMALVASLEIYHLQGEKEKLRSTIGQLLYLSHNGDVLDMIKTDNRRYFPYTPDPKKFLPILKNAFLQLADDSTR